MSHSVDMQTESVKPLKHGRGWLRRPLANVVNMYSSGHLLWLTVVLVACIALLPRVAYLADFFTEDESFHWVWRVQHFAGSLRQERWADTNLTGHPGVTTLWLGTMGRWVALALGVPLQGLADGSANIDYLSLLRLPLALVNALAVVVGYLLLRRLVRPTTALVAALLWATAPFLVAHSRLLHLDALLTSFMTLSLLTLLVAFASPTASGAAAGSIRYRLFWIVLSGVCGGLALLTKAPSLLLLPFVGLVCWSATWFGSAQPWTRRIAATTVFYFCWLGVAALTAFIGWPALWVTPGEAIGAVLSEVRNNGAVPHHTGNYFLGQPAADPGWLFYPAVLLWRSSPLLLGGLLLLLFVWLVWRSPPTEIPVHERFQQERRVLLVLLVFVVLFTLALSVAAKKFDRYLLPIWPALAVLAAVGLVGAWERLQAMVQQCKHKQWSSLSERFTPLLPLLAAGWALGSLIWYHPYHLAYFNPVLGGSATAQRVLLVGWGEGMEQVGAWLRTRPDLTRSPVLTWGPRTLEPFIPGRTLFLNEGHLAEPASYAVLYVRSVQRGEATDELNYLRETTLPLHTVRRYGIDYAKIYQPPQPYTTPVDALFGEGLHLRGFSQQQLAQTLVITPSWNLQHNQSAGLFTFVHVLDADGTRVAQVDASIDGGLFDTWQAGQQFGNPLPITLPPELPTGPYTVALGVYQPASGARLPLVVGTPLSNEIAGPDTLQLMTFWYANGDINHVDE